MRGLLSVVGLGAIVACAPAETTWPVAAPCPACAQAREPTSKAAPAPIAATGSAWNGLGARRVRGDVVDPEGLRDTKSLSCTFQAASTYSFDEGAGAPSHEELGLTFDSIDLEAGKSRLIGNRAAVGVSVIVRALTLVFTETTLGGVNFTTVFPHLVKKDGVTYYLASTFRPTNATFMAPSIAHYVGLCRKMQ